MRRTLLFLMVILLALLAGLPPLARGLGQARGEPAETAAGVQATADAVRQKAVIAATTEAFQQEVRREAAEPQPLQQGGGETALYAVARSLVIFFFIFGGSLLVGLVVDKSKEGDPD